MSSHFTDRLLFQIFPGYRTRQEEFLELLRKHLDPGSVWLDIGCGTNEQVSVWGNLCRCAVGVDRVIHDGRLPGNFVQADLRSLPFPASAADLITLRMVVEHMSEPERDFAELARVLKPGGKVILLTTNGRSPVIMLPRLLPMGLKMRIIRRLFGVQENDIFPTFHRFNTRTRILGQPAGLQAAEIRFLEQVPRGANPFLFFPFFGWYWLTSFRPLQGVRSNILAVLQKRRIT